MQELNLSDLYFGLQGMPSTYRLRSVVCYRGMHYHAFVRQGDSARWIDVSDSTFSPAGSWADCKAKCASGRSQPSLLFYEAHFAAQ